MTKVTAATAEKQLVVKPIGVVRSPFKEKVQAPRQPNTPQAAAGTVELSAGCDFEHALEDLATFRYIWLLFWFDQAEGWRPKVLPPRSDKRRGVFATRSPHRPNPIGMSLVELKAIEGLVLSVEGLDLLDGTPVLDIKPYIPYADSRGDADHGWLEEARDPKPGFVVEFAARAVTQLALLQTFGLELEGAIRQVLELGPEPHPYRRIKKTDRGAVLALKDFRVSFTSAEKRVTVTDVATGYRPQQLATLPDPALEAHRALAALPKA
ncbi:MAG: tRNA (N6-threonylcarbamoyladenosine(37)-N6)-methyltransferase TrmO [Myxococcales bacterium]|nr:MAG: tRNA (N6-threonylcarbamoyladenosine(37)-N6)-methyltransferase TrmO [Myxococcales bacterium]